MNIERQKLEREAKRLAMLDKIANSKTPDRLASSKVHKRALDAYEEIKIMRGS